MILADIYVPALNEQFDFKLDEYALIADVVEQVGDILTEGYAGQETQNSKKDLLLCDDRRKCVLPLDQTLRQNGIGNGSRLVLI